MTEGDRAVRPPLAQLAGVVAAAATPFGADDRLDLDRVRPLADFLVEHRVSAVMVGGTTGEFVAMTTDERVSLIAAFVQAIEGRVPVIAHVGHAYVAEACRLARRAAEVGADALTAITPYFHAVTDAAVERYMREVARVVPERPFFAYSFPAATGNRLQPDTFN